MSYEIEDSTAQDAPTSWRDQMPQRYPRWMTRHHPIKDRIAHLRERGHPEAIESARYAGAGFLFQLSQHPLWQRQVQEDFDVDVAEPQFVTMPMLMSYANNAGRYFQITFSDCQTDKKVFSFRSCHGSNRVETLAKRFADSFDRLVVPRDQDVRAPYSKSVQSRAQGQGSEQPLRYASTLAEIVECAWAASLKCSIQFFMCGARYRNPLFGGVLD